MSPTKAKHFAAMVLIGDGIMALMRPRQDAQAWIAGPRFWRNAMTGLSKRPGLTRAVGAAQLTIGILWALLQEEE